jgi:hypothetical protein
LKQVVLKIVYLKMAAAISEDESPETIQYYSERLKKTRNGFPSSYDKINFDPSDLFRQREKQYREITTRLPKLLENLYTVSSTGMISLPIFNSTSGFFCCLLKPQDNLVESDPGTPNFCLHPYPKFDGQVYRLRFGPGFKDWYFLRTIETEICEAVVTELKSDLAKRSMRNNSEMAKAHGYYSEPSIKDSFVGLDDFANEWIIGTFLAEYLKSNFLLNHITEFVGANICNSDRSTFEVLTRGGEEDFHKIFSGDSDSDYFPVSPIFRQETVKETFEPTLENIELLETSFLINFIKQTLLVLELLSKTNGFRHNTLNLHNIYLVPNRCSIIIAGKTYNFEFTVRFGDFRNSSLTINEGYRLYNHKPVSESYINEGMLSLVPEYHLGSPVHVIDFPEMSVCQHLPYPYYRNLDFFTFFISLVTIPQVFNTFFRSKEDIFKRIWDTCWFPESVSEVFLRVKRGTERELNHRDYLQILRGIPLRSDATKRIMDIIS